MTIAMLTSSMVGACCGGERGSSACVAITQEGLGSPLNRRQKKPEALFPDPPGAVGDEEDSFLKSETKARRYASESSTAESKAYSAVMVTESLEKIDAVWPEAVRR